MINWLTALKVLPWSDMIEYAPRVVSGAQKLWQRAKNQRADEIIIEQAVERIADPAQEIQQLKQQVLTLEAQQIEQSNLINELAEQNQRLVSAVDVLRVRTRILFWSSVAMGGAIIMLAFRVIYEFVTR